VFASEPAAVVAHPEVGARPDLVTVSAYLTTIRTVLGERTLFEGVRTLLPGEVIEFDLGEGRSAGQVTRTRHTSKATTGGDVREVITDSVMRHLRSDVPACSLLSGGLDSSIIAAVMRRGLGARAEIRTYASGFDDGTEETDLGFARRVAGELKTVHTAAPVTREMFAERWRGMIDRMGMPLSTPNEVAINEVARRLRADGQVVALSGEGADELFAGYELPMMQAWEFERRRRERGNEASRDGGEDGGLFQLRSNSWIAPEAKAVVLRPEVWRGVEQDAALRAWYSSEFAAIAEGCEGVQTHLSFHRRVNLTGLLQRLDTATMLEGVEGRTPFADVVVAGLADGLPMERKFVPGEGGNAGRAQTKIALREAFAEWLPREVVERPKASFPLPFQSWLVDHTRSLRESALAKALFGEAAVESVCADPGRMWSLAWPMINVAMWGERWWGE
jgi:asparagine synthase (glutamine-hydrolysing)